MTPATLKILLVEDDSRIRAELIDALHGAGFDVDVAVGVQDAIAAAQRHYDLMLLDLGLPDGDGLDVCRHLRAAGKSLPLLILTARNEPDQRVRGLDVGADDYVVKPFYMPELIARIRTVLRRVGRSAVGVSIACGDLRVDTDSRSARCGERELALKPREFDLLLFLAQRPGRAWTRDQILDRVWGSEYGGDARTVDTHIRRLRAVIEEDPSDPRYIETVWGVGYRMREA